jgi:diacylglycerol kinase (ATP)
MVEAGEGVRVRIVLMHNPAAGGEDHSARDLIRDIRRAGHEVVGDVSSGKELAAAIRGSCDLVVAAGGDGTVNDTAEALARTGVPFTIIPLGTANNLSRALGVHAGAADLIESWSRFVLRGLDRATAEVRERRLPFIEGFGFGVFPDVMRAGDRLPRPGSVPERLARDLDLFRSTLADAVPRAYTVSADGDDLSGEYLLVEVMNIDMLGPNIPLAQEARPGDGRLDLVLVGPDQRAALGEHLERLRAGRPSPALLPSRRVRRVVISSQETHYHQDGTLHEAPARSSRHHFDLVLEPHALQVLIPRSA